MRNLASIIFDTSEGERRALARGLTSKCGYQGLQALVSDDACAVHPTLSCGGRFPAPKIYPVPRPRRRWRHSTPLQFIGPLPSYCLSLFTTLILQKSINSCKDCSHLLKDLFDQSIFPYHHPYLPSKSACASPAK